MPNWANGLVEVKGNCQNVREFCKLFIFEDEDKQGKKYFGRSFVLDKWEYFEEEHFGDYKKDKFIKINFGVDFAWSCYCCLIKGYPDDNKCIDINWACKKYNVKVKITTEEDGNGFTEEITADKNGVNYETKDMPSYTCQNCRNTQTIGDSYDLSEVECYDCGTLGEWEDKLKKMINKKIENDMPKV